MKIRNHSSRRRRGASVLIILTLLACMGIMVAANSTALALLKQELKLVDQRQQQRHGQDSRH
jgi:type II secretory pathway component PulK